MRRRASLHSVKELSEISTTPLIDISMLLLVTFLITYPLMEQGVPVNLPKGHAETITPQHKHNITLNLQGEIFLDDQPVSLAFLQAELEKTIQSIPELTVYVRADKDIKYDRVMEIMRALHAANVTRVALVTQAD